MIHLNTLKKSMTNPNIELHKGDCLKLMEKIQDNSIDLILCDLPFGQTQNEWDKVIPFDELWKQYKRISKPNTAIILMGIQPFVSNLIVSNPEMYRYDLIWSKNKKTGFLNANKMPLRAHEHILVFYKELPVYNPQKSTGHKPVHKYTKRRKGTKKVDGENYGETKDNVSGGGSTERFPTSIIEIPCIGSTSKERYGHPTEKPVKLMEYLIKTYSNEGMIVLDNACGVASTGVACMNLNRKFIGIELYKEYYDKACQRLGI